VSLQDDDEEDGAERPAEPLHDAGAAEHRKLSYQPARTRGNYSLTEHQAQLALRRPPESENLRRQRYEQPAENEKAWAAVIEQGRCAVSPP
jgi:hypothetical protein